MAEQFKMGPENRNFIHQKDIHPVFALLREDYPAVLKEKGSAAKAMQYLQETAESLAGASSIYQNREIATPDQDAILFLRYTLDRVEHWYGLFQMLKKSGYTNMIELSEAAMAQIDKLQTADGPLTGEQKENLQELVHSALRTAFSEDAP